MSALLTLSDHVITAAAEPLQAEISLELLPGDRVSVTGPSGCGKSTLLRQILRKSSGSENIRTVEVRAGSLNYLPQSEFMFPWYTPRQNYEAWLSQEAISDEAMAWARKLGIEGVLDRRHSRLSGGEKQRVGIWLVLCSNADLVLLDEPFTALDLKRKFDCLECLGEWIGLKPRALLIVSHDFEILTYLSKKVLVLASSPQKLPQLIELDPELPEDRSSYLARHSSESYQHLLSVLSGQPRKT